MPSNTSRGLSLVAALGLAISPAVALASGPDAQPTQDVAAAAVIEPAYPTIDPRLLQTAAEDDPAAQRQIIDHAANPGAVSVTRLQELGMDETAAKIISHVRNEGLTPGPAEGQTPGQWWSAIEPDVIQERKTQNWAGYIWAGVIGGTIGLIGAGGAASSAPRRRF
ncbi:MAG: hypothetical protein AAF213_11370 [Pseudomonadota bacterium]